MLSVFDTVDANVVPGNKQTAATEHDQQLQTHQSWVDESNFTLTMDAKVNIWKHISCWTNRLPWLTHIVDCILMLRAWLKTCTPFKVHQLHMLTMCCCLSSRSSGGMAADDKSSSSTDWSVEPPVISPTSPSHLTHFKPLTPEQDEPPLRSAYSSFVSLFRFNSKGQGCTPNTSIQVYLLITYSKYDMKLRSSGPECKRHTITKHR